MPPEEKLNLNLSSLWRNPNHRFTLRFRDLNESFQNILAQRIKTLAKQARIRNQNGPNLDTIHSALKTINPIIFSEGTTDTYRAPFHTYATQKLDGYQFRDLCQSIYHLVCRTTPLTRHEKNQIIRLTCNDYYKRRDFEDENLPPEHTAEPIRIYHNQHTTTEQNTNLETNNIGIGLEELENIRHRIERENQTTEDDQFTIGSNPQPIINSNNFDLL